MALLGATISPGAFKSKAGGKFALARGSSRVRIDFAVKFVRTRTKLPTFPRFPTPFIAMDCRFCAIFPFRHSQINLGAGPRVVL